MRRHDNLFAIAAFGNDIASGSILHHALQLRVACEEATALHFIATGFEGVRLIDPGCQIALIVLFRDFDGYVFAVVFNYRED